MPQLDAGNKHDFYNQKPQLCYSPTCIAAASIMTLWAGHGMFRICGRQHLIMGWRPGFMLPVR